MEKPVSLFKNGAPVRRRKVMKKIGLVFIFLVVLSAQAWATDYYVKTPANGGSDSNDGLTWATAKATIGAAMALVVGSGAINVAAGTYNEKIVFPGFDNVALRGGYPAGGGAQDPATNPTIVDGTGLVTTAAMVYIPMKPGGMSGYFGIVIDGFTIRNGTRSGSGVAGIESYSLGITITRNIIENNQVTGTGGTAGGIYIFGPYSDNNNGRTVIERNIIRNNAAAAVGGVYLEGASDKAKRYVVYLVNNLIYGNQSTTTDDGWNRGVGGIDIMYPASASIVNCTIADNTAAHPDPAKAVGGISVNGFPGQNGIAAIANSIIWHASGKDILTAADGTGILWIAYSAVKDAGISGTGVIHLEPKFVGPADYHLAADSPCKNTGSNAGTVLTGTRNTMYDIGYKNPPYNYPDANVTWAWGDGLHNLQAQWQYDNAMTTILGHPVGRFFGTSNTSCTADSSPQQVISNISLVDASTFSYATTYNFGESTNPKYTLFWRGTNGYFGAWRIEGMSATQLSPPYSGYVGRLNVTHYFQTNGSPYFDNGIRNVDLEGNPRPNETAYDMGAYEKMAADTTPPTGTIAINGVATYANASAVTLTLSASDPSGVTHMCLSDTASCASWEAYTTTKAWILPSGDGSKTVNIWFRDGLGNENAAPFSDSITLDSTAPADGTLLAASGHQKVQLTWSGFSDALSGITGYKLVYSEGGIPASCSAGTEIYNGTGTSFLHTPLTNGTPYYYRVCALDGAGNTSTGASASGTPFPDNDNDGVSDQVESGPTGLVPDYDGNGDGTADRLQTNVTSLPTSVGSGYVTLASPNGTTLSNVRAQGNPSPGDAPAGVTFPYGFFDFIVTGLTPGGSTTVTLYLPVGFTPNTYYKFGPTPGNSTPHWYEFLYDGQTGAQIAGNVVTLHFVDGQRGDDVLTTDGLVIDQGGPGVAETGSKLYLPLIKK